MGVNQERCERKPKNECKNHPAGALKKNSVFKADEKGIRTLGFLVANSGKIS